MRLTALYVPGDRPDRFGKAVSSGADEVILDLEDAVAPDQKATARDAAVLALSRGADPTVRALVRINAAGSPPFEDDIAALIALTATPGHRLAGLMLPKAQDPDAVTRVTSHLLACDEITQPWAGNVLREAAERHLAGNGPIRRVEVVDVRQSMANGGGPACLRLRVVADPGQVDQRFIADPAKLDRIAAIVERRWPAEIGGADLQQPAMVRDVEAARAALLEALDLSAEL